MKVLVVIDMQNDFIDGALGTKEAVAIVENVEKKIQDCKKQGYKIVFTRDTHSENYLETQEGKNLPIKHCIINTNGHQISSKLDCSNSKIINKTSFGTLELGEFLKTLEKIEEIEIIGLCTDICVISDALILKAFFPEVPIAVDSSCCAGVTTESHTNALNAMKMCQILIK